MNQNSPPDPTRGSISQVFVYGTLKRGQCRGGRWPAKPLSVEPAWTNGALFSGDHYPALIAGTDRVLGELWRFAPADMDVVLQVLDRIEGTNQPNQPDLYHRVVASIYGPQAVFLGAAFTYHYATDPREAGFTRLVVSRLDPWVQWPDAEN